MLHFFNPLIQFILAYFIFHSTFRPINFFLNNFYSTLCNRKFYFCKRNKIIVNEIKLKNYRELSVVTLYNFKKTVYTIFDCQLVSSMITLSLLISKSISNKRNTLYEYFMCYLRSILKFIVFKEYFIHIIHIKSHFYNFIYMYIYIYIEIVNTYVYRHKFCFYFIQIHHIHHKLH